MITSPVHLSLTVDAVTLVAWGTALNNLYLGLLAWWEGRSLVAARLFTALAIVAAWWCFWLGFAFTELAADAPQWFHASQLLSGFAGPLLFLFVLFHTGIATRWRPRYALFLLAGLFGTLDYLGERCLLPPETLVQLVHYLQTGDERTYASLRSLLPGWYLPLQWLHAAQLLGFFLAAGLVILIGLWRRRIARRREALFLAGLVLTALAAVTIANIWPMIEPRQRTVARLAPLVTMPLLSLLFVFLRRRVETAARLARERAHLLRYLPVRAVDQLVGHEREVVRRLEAAVLFCDIRGFTSISERLTPEELVAWIDRYFQSATEVILAHEGMVDKLIGDGILAAFGVPEPDPDACAHAVDAAFELLERLRAVVPAGAEVSYLRLGLGIHYGPIVVGSVGGEYRREYTVFGDTVNTASRLEGWTKETAFDLVITAAVYERLRPDQRAGFAPAGEVRLRGKHRPLPLYGATVEVGGASRTEVSAPSDDGATPA